MNLIKVLGIGSPFGEDQAGWLVADRLKTELSKEHYASKTLIIESYDRPGLLLIELMNPAKVVFLIDAVKSGCAPGTIHRLKNNEIFAFQSRLSTHEMGVAEALQIGQSLNDLPEDIILYGIEIDNTTFNTALSKSVKKAMREVVIQIKKEIEGALKLTI
ncbi:TPA: hydrogenase maturation protease [Legionella pneumophila]|uniref:hydrogenase maturation protease n=1 Tax=Legionella pneumophila TaxID=446 RepID=UPI00048F9F69|nr:hydrogenase maturation protease [Legionella pneumophila]MDW8878122.1 hydrogenase maturation protease [Legionella pneumophila subsp. fraseri]MDW8962485.1 hydrogenase maturation protease [Legionella pneumophila subsp. fraseri]MDW9036136.1 hydrogenase maturation protease [Legionella pneumophila subsp. fraseri]MDW9038716.1 hydrogenase maturation protease [Legionella pneumophila subsp. fraseri]MDW9042436.1 hydrogenase maturation protease [Legionella pneumophila subsp. fraseri]